MSQKFRPIYFVIATESTLAVFVAALIGLFQPQSAISALIGGALFVIPNAYFTVLAFRYRGADMASWIVKSFSRGQSGKIFLTMFGFAVVFKTYEDLNVTALLAAYLVMLVLHIFIAKAVSDRFYK